MVSDDPILWYSQAGGMGVVFLFTEEKPMREKEEAQRLRLMEQELAGLAEHLDQSRLEWRGQLDEMKLEIESLKAFLLERDPQFSGHFSKIKAQVFREKNPEWM